MSKKEVKEVNTNTEYMDIIKGKYNPSTKINWNGIDINVINTLPLGAVIEYVDAVVSMCFSSDDGEYMPEVKSFAEKIFAIETYTDLVLPEDVEQRYEVIMCSDIFDTIYEHINKSQYTDMLSSIEDRLYIMAESTSESFKRQLTKLENSFEDLLNQIEEVFSGISPDDVASLINSINDSGMIDEEKIVTALLKHKKD